MAGRMAGCLLVTMLAGCGGMTPPDAARLTWLGYLSGEDMRRVCAEGRPDRFRLVLNADYNRPVRTYDIVGDDTGGASIEMNEVRAPDIAHIDLSVPLAGSRDRAQSLRLGADNFAEIRQALIGSGAIDGAEEGRQLPSDGFYWLVSGCWSGRWFFSAFPYPPERFKEAFAPVPLGGRQSLRYPSE